MVALTPKGVRYQDVPRITIGKRRVAEGVDPYKGNGGTKAPPYKGKRRANAVRPYEPWRYSP